MSLTDDIARLKTEIATAIAAAADEGALDAVRVSALGKKGSVSALLSTLGSMPAEERKSAGPLINGLKNDVSGLIEAKGGALLPGLHDHHIHLAGLAVRAESISCGPPEVNTAEDLAAQLGRPGTGWLRGIGYHESVMGLPDAQALDRLAPDRPLRIQHRSGRLWLLNSRALAELLARAEPPPGLDRATGHLFDEDRWLQETLAGEPPDFAAVSADLARCGITGITDMTPRNDPIKQYVDHVRVLLDADRGLVLAFEMTDPDGEVTRLRFSDIRVDTGVPDSAVELHAPADAKIVKPLGDSGVARP